MIEYNMYFSSWKICSCVQFLDTNSNLFYANTAYIVDIIQSYKNSIESSIQYFSSRIGDLGGTKWKIAASTTRHWKPGTINTQGKGTGHVLKQQIRDSTKISENLGWAWPTLCIRPWGRQILLSGFVRRFSFGWPTAQPELARRN
jgi:hypothetical protein